MDSSLAVKHSLGYPKDLDDHAWWYEEEGGICMVIEMWRGGKYVQTEQRTIPWKDVRAALGRKDRKPSARLSCRCRRKAKAKMYLACEREAISKDNGEVHVRSAPLRVGKITINIENTNE